MIEVRRDDGLVIGEVDEAGVFRKRVRGSQHFLRQPPAIAFDRSTLAAAEQAGALSLEVIDLDTNSTYRCSISVFRSHCLFIDRGFGLQWALPLRRWNVLSTAQPRLL
jgi:hypothetical protein